MAYRKVYLVLLLLAALSASAVVYWVKAGKKADLGAAECTHGKTGKRCKLERTKDKDIFASNDISIQLEADGIIQFVGGSHQGGINKQPQWYGVSADNFAMNLIESGGKLYGSYSDKDFIYSISTDDDGNPIVTGKLTADFPEELDADDLNFETFLPPGNHTDHGEGAGDGETVNANVFVHESMRKLGLRGGPVSSSLFNTTQRQLAEAHTTLDIMVVWTTNAECKRFGKGTGCTPTAASEAAMRGLIDLAVSETNVAFENSGIFVNLQLVHAYREPTYIEPGTDAFSNALYGMYYDEMESGVHQKRADYGADLVAMIIHDSAYCGLGFLGPRQDLMFSVSSWNCATGYFSFGHEIGHNMGCNHDRGTKNKCSDGNTNYGYREPATGTRSILAYSCRQNQCDDIKTSGSCYRIQRFSNPNYGGTANADNAARINTYREEVGSYFGQNSNQPSEQPSEQPSTSIAPSLSPAPSTEPSNSPSASSNPSDQPSEQPSTSAAPSLSQGPSAEPSNTPSTSTKPSDQPSSRPSTSAAPSLSQGPSVEPSETPSTSTKPSDQPSSKPSTSAAPSSSSMEPSVTPSTSTKPSDQPSSQPSVTPIWTQIFANDFEKGLGYFNDPGANAKYYNGSKGKKKKPQHSGYKSLELRDDTETSFSVTNPFPVSIYSALKVEFWYKSSGFKHDDDGFVLQSTDGDDGINWVTKGSWIYESNDFTSNNVWRFASVKFQIDATTMHIRFKNNGHNGKEKIYIDDVIVSGGFDPSAMPSSLPSSLPSLSNAPSLSTVPSSEPSTSPAPSLSQEPSMEPSETPSTSTKPSDQPSSQPSVTPIWTHIFTNDFEKDLGYFNDPGANAKRYSKGKGKKKQKQHSGYKSLELRDDTDTSLSFTNPFPVSDYSTLKVEFWYKSSKFNDASDGFVLESSDGDSGTDWVTKGSWTYKSNGFDGNNVWRSASVQFQIEADTMRIRFRNKADSGKEKLYIDDVIVTGGYDPSAV